MIPKYQDWLAANVLNEGVIVNYRMLSRALKVHNNAAKEMLYDFHRTQNARKADSLYATYLLTGTKKPPSQTPNGTTSQGQAADSLMSDDLMSSSMPQPEEETEQVPVISVTLVAQEQLGAVKQSYSHISSIHVYSLSPGPLSNIQILSDCNRKVAHDYASEDPLETWKTYGTIHNPNTKRRNAKRPPPPAAAAATMPATAGMKPTANTTANTAAKPTTSTNKPAAPPSKQEEKDTSKKDSRSGSEAPPAAAAPKSDTKKPAPLRKESSSLFKSFAKIKAPASKKEDPASEDVSMTGADSEEGEEEIEGAAPEDEVTRREAVTKAEAARKRKEEAEQKMQDMMDASDDEQDADALPGIDVEAKIKDQESDEAMGGTMTEAEQVAADTGALDAEEPTTKAGDAAEQVMTSNDNGRRRGRRKIMKKKTTKDAEGYLVTREEPAWESFSEDESTETARKRPAVSVAPPGGAGGAAGAGGAKKGAASGGSGGKKGQAKSGNIMSFFGKKG